MMRKKTPYFVVNVTMSVITAIHDNLPIYPGAQEQRL